MVDVSEKEVTTREARAEGSVRMSRETLEILGDESLAKGDVLGVARIAGIMGAKRTYELIPLCHGIPLSVVRMDFTLDRDASRVQIKAMCRTVARTGVEMEALTAVSVAALTIYDMCKAVDRSMTIGDIRVTYKTGGRSGTHGSPQ